MIDAEVAEAREKVEKRDRLNPVSPVKKSADRLAEERMSAEMWATILKGGMGDGWKVFSFDVAKLNVSFLGGQLRRARRQGSNWSGRESR